MPHVLPAPRGAAALHRQSPPAIGRAIGRGSSSRKLGLPSLRRRVRQSTSHSAAATARRVCVASVVTDPGTKLTFPEVVDGLKCLGVGSREKKVAFINVKVYSVALYVKEERAAEALVQGSSLLDGVFEKMLIVKLARKVDGKTFWEALNEAVMPRIAQIATDQATAEDEDGNFMAEVAEAAEVKEEAARDAAEDLGDLIQGANLDNETEALFDVYLGEDPISPAAKEAFEAGASAL